MKSKRVNRRSRKLKIISLSIVKKKKCRMVFLYLNLEVDYKNDKLMIFLRVYRMVRKHFKIIFVLIKNLGKLALIALMDGTLSRIVSKLNIKMILLINDLINNFYFIYHYLLILLINFVLIY